MSIKMLVVSFVLLYACALSTPAVFGADMLAGTWKANIEKSTYSPGPPPKGPNTIQFTPVDNGLRVELNGVNAAGQKTHVEYTAKFDGKDYPATRTLDGKPNSVNETYSVKKIDDYNFEFTSKRPGLMPAVIKIVVAKDGKTHTAVQTGENTRGQRFNDTILMEKQ